MTTPIPDSRIRLGNQEGRWFSRPKFDKAVGFAHELCTDIVPELKGPVDVWYDAENDFTHVKFILNGKTFDVRYYKVWSIAVDGENVGWGFPNDWAMLMYIKRQAVTAQTT